MICERCEKREALPTDEYCEECLQNMSEAAYERSLSDCYRGTEAASALVEEQARVQRLK